MTMIETFISDFKGKTVVDFANGRNTTFFLKEDGDTSYFHDFAKHCGVSINMENWSKILFKPIKDVFFIGKTSIEVNEQYPFPNEDINFLFQLEDGTEHSLSLHWTMIV